MARKITAKTMPSTATASRVHRKKLDATKSAIPYPMVYPNIQVPLRGRFHHIFLFPTSLWEMRWPITDATSAMDHMIPTRPRAIAQLTTIS